MRSVPPATGTAAGMAASAATASSSEAGSITDCAACPGDAYGVCGP
ncbi:hypothetical protein [Streptomyces katrae]|nr:hypothetical protein [Streptomyces katrae]